MNKKTRKIFIKRIDTTMPMTEEETKRNKRIPKWFICSVNAEIPPTHKMLK